MRIRANRYGCSAPDCKVEPAHVSLIPTIAVPAVPPVPKPLLCNTAHFSAPDYTSPTGERNYADGGVTQSSEQGNDVWTTTVNESDNVWYRDWLMDDVDAGIAKEHTFIDRDGFDLQAVDFCDTICPPSLWYPDLTMSAPYATIDPAHTTVAPSFGDSPASSTFGDPTHGFDETPAPMGKVSEILRKSATLKSQRFVRANFSQTQTTRTPCRP
jgi:hypothetical protein